MSDGPLDPRAIARWKAKQSLSPSEFGEWENNVGRVNRGLAPVRKSSAPGIGDEDDDDFTTALGRDIGMETSEYKGAPVYDNGVKKAARAPGIYVPEGGALAGGEMNSETDRKIASFETPQETLQKKYAGRLGKMGADEKELTYRKAKGMQVPEGLSARMKAQGLKDKFNAFADVMGGARAPGLAPGVSPKPDGDGFIGGIMKGLGGDTPDLVSEAAKAPAVAFNGRGPVAPGLAATTPAAVPGTNGGRDAMFERFMSKELGLPYVDEEERGYKRTLRDRETQEWTAKQAQMELDKRLKEFQLKRATMSPMEQAKEAVELSTLQRQIQEGQKTPLQKLQDENALKAAQREQTGDMAPAEQKKAIADAAMAATKRASELAEQMPWEQAQQQALMEVNARLKAVGITQQVAPEFLASSKPIVDTRTAALMKRAVAAGYPTPTHAFKDALLKVVQEDPSMRSPIWGSKYTDVDKAGLFGTSPMQKGGYQRKKQAEITQYLMGKGFKPEEAQKVVEENMAPELKWYQGIE